MIPIFLRKSGKTEISEKRFKKLMIIYLIFPTLAGIYTVYKTGRWLEWIFAIMVGIAWGAMIFFAFFEDVIIDREDGDDE